MIPELRRRFNSNFTPELYARFLAQLDERCGTHVKFRNCETPCFFPKELLARIADAGADMINQLVNTPAYLAAAHEQIPPEFRVPGVDSKPLFTQADFGLVKDDSGEYRP